MRGIGRSMGLRLLSIAALGLALASAPATAQDGVDMGELVVDWARGRFASPVLCELDGTLTRGIRRVVIKPEPAGAPGASAGRRASLLVQFVDMRVAGAARCINSLGVPQPNTLGRLQLRLPGQPHPETGLRDFKLALRRDKGFVFEVVSGVLKLQQVSVPASSSRSVDYRGGSASLSLVMPASDDDKELSAFPSPRKAVLTLQPKGASEGDVLRLPIFLTDER